MLCVKSTHPLLNMNGTFGELFKLVEPSPQSLLPEQEYLREENVFFSAVKHLQIEKAFVARKIKMKGEPPGQAEEEFTASKASCSHILFKNTVTASVFLRPPLHLRCVPSSMPAALHGFSFPMVCGWLMSHSLTYITCLCYIDVPLPGIDTETA